MKSKIKQLIFTLLFMCFSFILFSQPIFKDSTNAYNYWATRGIIEMVYAHMQDSLATVDATKSKKEKKGAESYYAEFIKNIGTKDTTQVKNDFLKINSFLKENNWESISKNYFDPLNDNYMNNKQLGDQFFTKKRSTNTDKFWKSKKDSILNAYNNAKSKFVSQIHPPLPTKNWIDYIYNFICFLGGLILGAFLVFIYSTWSIYSILSNEKHKYIYDLRRSRPKYLFKYIGLFEILKKSKDEYKAKVNDAGSNFQINLLNQQIAELNIQNGKLLNENIELKKQIEIPNPVIMLSSTNEAVYKENLSILNIRYFTIPEVDGTFKIANGKNSSENECFYKIVIDKSGQKGNLYFLSGDFDSRALDNIDYYLNPVCEIENISERANAHKIRMERDGSVFLSGESWKIDASNKIKIRLI